MPFGRLSADLFSSETHLALTWAGLATADLSPHPLWGRTVSAFGLNAGVISALAGGLSAGLLAWNVARMKGWTSGLVASVLFAFSPPVWKASTHVGSMSFDMVLVLLMLTFVGGRKWRRRLPFALGVAGLLFWDMAFVGIVNRQSLFLDGMVALAALAAIAGLVFGGAQKARNPLAKIFLSGGVILCALFMPVFGLLSPSRNVENLAETIAAEILAKVGSDVKWLIVDGVLEDAFARQLATRESGPFLVSTAHEFDEPYLTNLAHRVTATYPRAGQLRFAATIGVKTFLEELPLVETNRAAVVFAWQRSWWPKEAREKLVVRLTDCTAADPLRKYVRERLDRLSRPLGEFAEPNISPAQVNAFVDRFSTGFGTNGLDSLRKTAHGLLRADRLNPLGNAVLGSLAAQDGNLADAEAFFARAVVRGNAPGLVYNDYAETLRRLGKLDEAARMARRAVDRAPSEWRAWETLADVLTCQGADETELEHALSQAECLSVDVKDDEKYRLIYLRARQLKRLGKDRKSNAISQSGNAGDS